MIHELKMKFKEVFDKIFGLIASFTKQKKIKNFSIEMNIDDYGIS